jgi:prostaglandin-E synthase 1
MKELMENPAFRTYVLCAAALAFNPLILAGMTGGSRGKFKSPATPEDAKPGGDPYRDDVAPEVARLIRAHRNALENIPLALIAGLVYVLVGASPTMVLVLMGINMVFRWLHSVFYLKAIQPWRTATFAIAASATGVMLIHSVVLVVRGMT